MEILILQYALAVLICMWWIKPFHTLSLGKNLKVSLFNIMCISSLLFLGSYMLLRQLSARDIVPGIVSVLFHCINLALFLLVPAGFLYLRKQFEHKHLSKFDLVHLLPSLVYLGWFVAPGLVYGKGFLAAVNDSAYFFSIYAYCTIGIYIVLIMKFLLYKYLSFPSLSKKNKNQAEIAAMKNEEPAKVTRGSVLVGSVHLEEEQLVKMDETLKTFFLAEQPFLTRGYNLKQLSEDTSIPLHHLSAFINQYYHIHFNDFINEYRVQYCQVKIRNDEWRAKTLEAIAEESGFNNRNTFTAAFKKVTGYNPSDYLKMVKQQKIA